MGAIFRVDKVLDSIEKSFLVDGVDEFTYELRLTEEIRKNFSKFEREIKNYEEIEIVEWKNARLSGMKTGFPSSIKFGTSLIYKERPEFKKIRRNFEAAIGASTSIDVKAYIKNNFALCKKNFEDLPASVSIAQYMIENRVLIKNLLPRQIAHGQSTKLLADNPLVKGLLTFKFYDVLNTFNGDVFEYLELKKKPISFQFFANKVSIRGFSVNQFYGVINEKNISDFVFEVSKTIIIENEESFFPMAEGIDDALVIFGGGWKASALKQFSHLFPGKLFYWGDIDSEGFEILNGVSSHFPALVPVAMDNKTIMQFSSLSQKVKKRVPAGNIKLLKDEYDQVCELGIRIEQEQLDISYVIKEIVKC